jgi:hypothetical protein
VLLNFGSPPSHAMSARAARAAVLVRQMVVNEQDEETGSATEGVKF